MSKPLTVNEIFYSVQGEGARAGSANVFVRLSGCNLTCSKDGPEGFDCDTEFASGRAIPLEELVAEVKRIGGPCRNVIFTGGEPALQLTELVVAAFKAAGFVVCVETNGTRKLPPNIDWVSCSPKTAEHTLRLERVDELRYVRHVGQAIPRPALTATHYFVSPAWDGDRFPVENLAHCIALVKENPQWSLSVQQHKLWRVR